MLVDFVSDRGATEDESLLTERIHREPPFHDRNARKEAPIAVRRY